MFGLTPYRRRNYDLQGGVRRAGSPFDIMSFFEDFFNDPMVPSIFNNNNIKVDIKENDKEYLIEAELPGVDKNDVKLEIRDDMLTLSVQRNEILEENRDNYIRKERRTSAMTRSFWIGNVKEDEIKARLENGLLTIELPKTEDVKTKSRRIDIN